MKINLVRGREPLPPKTIWDYAINFFLLLFDGWTRTDKRLIRKLIQRMQNMEPGEFASFEMVIKRSSQYHRRHMKIESDVFDAQERFADFDMFRNWLKIGAAWVEWVPGAKGGIVPLPKSISYAKADQAEFEQFHQSVIGFLRGPHAAPYLWKHLGDKSHEMMDSILNEFNE